MENWLNIPEQMNWKDGNGNNMTLPKNRLRAVQGFIPPAFSYFPTGQMDQSYNGNTYEDGRKKCMEACIETDCLALQTEVPENCYQQVIPDNGITDPEDPDFGKPGFVLPTDVTETELGDFVPKQGTFDNGCGNRSTHSCSLFYDDINKADDAYYTLHSKEPSKLGQKYYTNETNPDPTPGTGKPSEETVKFCPSYIGKLDARSAKYATLKGYPKNSCKCVDEDICTDPKCCKFRRLLTTDFVKESYPYFTLPVAVDKIPDSGPLASLDYICDAEWVISRNPDKTEPCGVEHMSGSLEFGPEQTTYLGHESARDTDNMDKLWGMNKGDFNDLKDLYRDQGKIITEDRWKRGEDSDSQRYIKYREYVDNRDFKLKSCPEKKCTSEIDENCWQIKTVDRSGEPYCDGSRFTEDAIAQNALHTIFKVIGLQNVIILNVIM